MCGQGCLFSEADGDGASKREKKKYGGVYTLCLSKLEPLAVPGLAHTYMAADQSLNPFQTLPYLEIHNCECSYLHVSLGMNSPMGAYMCQVWGEKEESVKRNESVEKPGALRSHFMSLQTGTLDSRSLAYFSCHPAAKSDYYPTVLGK